MPSLGRCAEVVDGSNRHDPIAHQPTLATTDAGLSALAQHTAEQHDAESPPRSAGWGHPRVRAFFGVSYKKGQGPTSTDGKALTLGACVLPVPIAAAAGAAAVRADPADVALAGSRRPSPSRRWSALRLRPAPAPAGKPVIVPNLRPPLLLLLPPHILPYLASQGSAPRAGASCPARPTVTFKRAKFCMLSAAVLAIALSVHAQRNAQDVAQARVLFNDGMDLKEKGDIKGALEKFMPRTLGNTPLTGGSSPAAAHQTLHQLGRGARGRPSVGRIGPHPRGEPVRKTRGGEAAKIAEAEKPKMGSIT